MLDRSRIQGFGSESVDDKEKPGFFGGLAMQSAIDSVSLKFGDALEEFKEEMDRPWTPLQDISGMAQEIKTFVAGAVGLETSAGGPQEAPDEEAKDPAFSPRQRTEAASLISKFCQGYTHARVVPTAAELAKLWVSCNALQPNVVSSVLYEKLSFSDGEFEWQPRLRILYFLEVLYWKGGASEEIATGIHSHAAGLLQHLATEVLQTKEKAKQVLETLAGNVAEAPPGMADVDKVIPAATANSAAKEAPTPKAAPPAQDLLDLAAPVVSSSASSTASPVKAPKATPPVDLLDSGDPEPIACTPPPVGDLLSITMANEASPSKLSPGPAGSTPSKASPADRKSVV